MPHLKYLILILMMGCSSTGQDQELYSISSKAKCKGPNIEYHTALHATTDGYFRFHQSYYEDDTDYDAVAYSDTLGFTLEKDNIKAPIEANEISVGKGHSFHMIAYQPQVVFNYSNGKYFDAAGHEVKIKFEPNSNRVESFQIINPFNSSEKIDIYYSKWEDVQDFTFPMHVQIIQGGKDEYFFEFYEVRVNDSSFSKIPAP